VRLENIFKDRRTRRRENKKIEIREYSEEVDIGELAILIELLKRDSESSPLFFFFLSYFLFSFFFSSPSENYIFSL
jgi:hypothetical protein